MGEILGDLYDIYYNNRDLRLLLDLLATSSGVAPAIAIMTLFDKKFREAMKPQIQYVIVPREQGLAEVRFQEPKTAVEAFESKYIPENECEGGEKDNCAGDIEMAPLRGFIQRASFTGLKKDVKYTVKVR